jgi:hypothetical protein
LKKILLLSSFVLLLASCAPPIEEGVYFEIDGNSYQTSENMSYRFGASTAGYPNNTPMYFEASYYNSAFKFGFFTFSFNPGKYNCNQLTAGSVLPIVTISMEILDSNLGWIGEYKTTTDPLNVGEESYVEIISLNDQYLEIRFNIILKRLPSYPDYHLNVKNGYLKLYL